MTFVCSGNTYVIFLKVDFPFIFLEAANFDQSSVIYIYSCFCIYDLFTLRTVNNTTAFISLILAFLRKQLRHNKILHLVCSKMFS
jgi:hypothetical protein